MRAKRICANTFPDTDKREIGLQLLHSDCDPLPLCKASLIGFSAPFRSSAVMPSAPAARPF